MEKDVLLWIMGVLVTANSAVIAGGIKAYIDAIKTQNGLDRRMVKMETTLELLGFNAAKALHCPTTPDLDILLEKYCKQYEDSHYNLPYEDWVKLNDICNQILENKNLTTGYRAAAGIVQALCHHKLSGLEK